MYNCEFVMVNLLRGASVLPSLKIPTVPFFIVAWLITLLTLFSKSHMVPHCPGTSAKAGSSLSLSKITSFSKSSSSALKLPLTCKLAFSETKRPELAWKCTLAPASMVSVSPFGTAA